ncbi:MAG: GNAT family N-acetyltransferase [Acidimicrobiales bacterium]
MIGPTRPGPTAGRPPPGETRDTSELLQDEPFEGEAAQALLAGFVAEISRLYPGWTPATGPSAGPRDFEPPGGRFVVARVDGQPVACGGLKRLDAGAAEIKRLYVRPDARRRGLGARMLLRLEEVAAVEGYRVVRLDTGADQPDAVRLFTAAGYREVADYNANPYARRWFEKPLR